MMNRLRILFSSLLLASFWGASFLPLRGTPQWSVRSVVPDPEIGEPNRITHAWRWYVDPKLKDEPLSLHSNLNDGEGGVGVIETPIGSTAVLENFLTNRTETVIVYPNSSFAITNQGLTLLQRGRIWIANRGAGVGEFLMQVEANSIIAAPKGTEYAVEVDSNTNHVRFTLFEGQLSFIDSRSRLVQFLTNRAIGQEPLVLDCISDEDHKWFISERQGRSTKWWLYYPSVLVPEEIPTTDWDDPALLSAFQMYCIGDIAGARRALPNTSSFNHAGVREFIAAVKIAAGEVEDGGKLLREGPTRNRLTDSLLLLLDAIGGETNHPALNESQSGVLAQTWWLQSNGRIDDAAKLLRSFPKTGSSPWILARLSQLEFAVGNNRAAWEASESALIPGALSLGVAAIVIRGYVLAARGFYAKAEAEFDRALSIDPLGADALFGRGLVKYRQGRVDEGIAEVRLAARRQRDRALFRIYLARLQLNLGTSQAGIEESILGVGLDPLDPTGWWFSALENYQTNRLNSAAILLNRALDLNFKRDLERGSELLNGDQSIRLASQARIFQDAGLPQVATRLAGAAVALDPASYSAHLFLAEGFNEQRDPLRYGLRYDTLWFNELLLANAFAPAAAGPFSMNISQGEYSRLLDRDGFRGWSLTDVDSSGYYRERATTAAVFGDTAVSADFDWLDAKDTIYRNSIQRREIYAQVKHQVSLCDSALLFTRWSNFDGQDNFQRYDPVALNNQSAQFQESQAPVLIGIWRHQWSESQQSLFMAGYIENQQNVNVQQRNRSYLDYSTGGIFFEPFDETYLLNLHGFVAEVQHIFQCGPHEIVSGVRGGYSHFAVDSTINVFNPPAGELSTVASPSSDFVTPYIFDYFRVVDSLTVLLGLEYSYQEYPANIRRTPIASSETTESRLLPKIGFSYRPNDRLQVRGIYSESLIGMTFDDSIRLDPQVYFGIPGSLRTYAPAVYVGSAEGSYLRVAQVSLDFSPSESWFTGISGRIVYGDVSRPAGLVLQQEATSEVREFASLQRQESIGYDEYGLSAWSGWLIGGSSYANVWITFVDASINNQFSYWDGQASKNGATSAKTLGMGGTFGMNLSSGWFWSVGGRLYRQLWENGLPDETRAATGDDSLGQIDVQLGWRFPRRQGEIAFGVANLEGKGYRLDPLAGAPEYPRERILFVRALINFGPFESN